jgi:arylsulfatase A-like enzyme
VRPLARGLVVAGILSSVAPSRALAQEAPSTPPNVVVIVTDDQRFDTLWAMPVVERELVARGASFPDAFVVNAICCPSRASILTGEYSHTTGVYRQTPPFGRFEWFRDGSTLATWLHDAGYTTGLFGKYIDGYQHPGLTGYVPPGWDRWEGFVHAGYLDYSLSVDGTIRSFGEAPQDYSTDVLANDAEAFIRGADGPLFLYLATAAPHGPAIPAPQDESTFTDLAPWRPPSYDEADVSDKPAWVRALPLLGPAERERIDTLRANQYRTLLPVDRAVEGVLQALRDTGRLENTLIVYTSDNGLSWGEHRWAKKEAPYEESIRVPLVVRWDAGGLVAGASPPALALNVDIAPTIADAVGIAAPGAEGRSLLPVLRGEPDPSPRADFLVEHLEGTNPVPTYCAVRSREWMYVRYTDGAEELYDLRADPSELENVAEDPSLGAVLADRRVRLETLCDPPPPGYGKSGLDARVLVGLGALLAALVLGAVRSRAAAARPVPR